MKYPCSIEFSESGRVAKIYHKNTTLLATLLIHGPFEDRTKAVHTHRCVCGHSSNEHEWKGTVNPPITKCTVCNCNCDMYAEQFHVPFRGETYGLSDWEFINPVTETVEERTNGNGK